MMASDAQGSATPQAAPATGVAQFPTARSARSRGKVLPEHARSHNRSLVLQTLFHDGAMSRADLSRETGLTRVTISDLVAELIDDGIVTEKGLREGSRPGKPATLVDIDREGHQIISIDLSEPDFFRGAVMTLDGDIVVRVDRKTSREITGEAALDVTADLARELVASATAPLLGIGIGTPGVVDLNGVVLTAPNFGWRNAPMCERVRDAVGLPVVVANDANVAVLAEQTFGGATADTLLIRVGLGVGSGLLAAGQAMIGGHFAAGEIGHVTVATDGGPLCACGKVGCLEAWLAVPALIDRIAATGDRDGVLRDAGERLGIALAPVIGVLDLSEIVIAGPEDLLGGILIETARETIRARTLAQVHDNIQLRMSEQGADIVLRGAAVTVLATQLGVS